MRATNGRLLAVLLVQFAILAAIPFRQVRARAVGAEITLATLPVDPRDLLSGHYVTLRYEAEIPRGLAELGAPADATVWVVVARGEPAWRPVAVAAARPATGPDQVAIRARQVDGRAVIPSAQRFYIPEARQDEVNRALLATRGAGLVDVRVDPDGNVALVRLRVGDVVVDK